MRKSLLATTALAAAGAFAAVPAGAADKLSVGVSGYMQQWIGMSDVDDPAMPMKEGGVAQQSDSEFAIKGRLEADNGLTFSVKIEVEGNSRKSGDPSEDISVKQNDSPIDESQLTVRGSFGEITLGAEDPAAAIMHYGNQDVGVGLNCGDVGKWINGVGGCSNAGLGTAGWGLGDRNNISYYTPRLAGVQFGASYIPNTEQEGETAPLNNNDMDAMSVGLNYMGDLGGSSVAFSAGHYQSATAEDDKTFTNFGLQVGFGAFGFDVAYAENDDGKMADGAGDNSVASAGVKYTDGPMAVSLSHMAVDYAGGDESSATMLSLSYSLAPGIASKTSIFGAEQGTTEGTAFVTGVTIGF